MLKKYLTLFAFLAIKTMLLAEKTEIKLEMSKAESGENATSALMELANIWAIVGLGLGLIPTIYFTVVNKNTRAWIISYFVGLLIYILIFKTTVVNLDFKWD